MFLVLWASPDGRLSGVVITAGNLCSACPGRNGLHRERNDGGYILCSSHLHEIFINELRLESPSGCRKVLDNAMS